MFDVVVAFLFWGRVLNAVSLLRVCFVWGGGVVCLFLFACLFLWLFLFLRICCFNIVVSVGCFRLVGLSLFGLCFFVFAFVFCLFVRVCFFVVAITLYNVLCVLVLHPYIYIYMRVFRLGVYCCCCCLFVCLCV